MTLTQPMKRYLLKAREIQQHRDYGVYWSLWIPGRAGTGRALLARGLIEPCHGSNGPGWPFQISDAGLKVAWDLWRAHKTSEALNG